jgi:hypothetical protein
MARLRTSLARLAWAALPIFIVTIDLGVLGRRWVP